MDATYEGEESVTVITRVLINCVNRKRILTRIMVVQPVKVSPKPYMDRATLTCKMEHYCVVCNHPSGIKLKLDTIREHIKAVKTFWGIGIPGAGLSGLQFCY